MGKTLLVLAAGMGSRYGGFKQIEPVGEHDELIIDYSVFDAIRAGFNKVVFVIRQDIEKDFCERFFSRIKKQIDAKYVFQRAPSWRSKPLGTTDAILSAKHLLDQPFCVISADDFYGADAFAKATANTAIGYRLVDTLSDYGTVNRGVIWTDDSKNVTSLSELKCLKREDKVGYLDGDNFIEFQSNQLASMLLFCFSPDIIPLLQEKFDRFLLANLKSQTAECILTTVLNDLENEGRVCLKAVETTGKWVGFTYPEDKPKVKAEIQRLVTAGVYPSPLWKNN